MMAFDVNALPDDWEALTSAGIVLAQNLDSGRWQLGDLAGVVTRRFGEDSLGQFASEIGIAKRQTLYAYAQVSARYHPSTREEFPSLSWSHYRAALRAKEDAELYLAQAADNNWPVAALEREIKRALGERVAPAKIYDGAGLVWQYANESRPYLVLDGDVSALKQGMRVSVRVWEAGAE